MNRPEIIEELQDLPRRRVERRGNVNVWEPSSEVEKSSYMWDGDPKLYSGKDSNSERDKMTVVELFSGCGGTSQGFKDAGFEVIMGLDAHVPSAKSFMLNHPTADFILGDIRTISTRTAMDVIDGKHPDVLIAGIPCQGFSITNRKRFEGDERNYLFEEFVRFLAVLKPSVFVLENVTGLRSTANGAFLHAIKEACEDVGNYKVEFKELNAASYGVPQLRKRIIFVGRPKNVTMSWPDPTFGPSTDSPYRTVCDAISDLPFIAAGEESSVYTSNPKCHYQEQMRLRSEELHNHVAPNHHKSTIEKITKTSPGDSIYRRFKQRIRLSWDQPSPTQLAGGIRPQYQFGHPEIPRGLTVRERARIQSFSDTFHFCGGVVQGRVQTGNAVPPILAQTIAEEIKYVLERDVEEEYEKYYEMPKE